MLDGNFSEKMRLTFVPLSVPLSDGKSYERSERGTNSIKGNSAIHDNDTNEGVLHIMLLNESCFHCCDSSHIKAKRGQCVDSV